MTKIYIKLKSFDSIQLKKSSAYIKNIINFIFQLNISEIPLPVKRRFITIMKSPHKYKKAREQYQQLIYKKLLIIELNENNKYFMNLISNISKNILLPGVEIELLYKYKTEINLNLKLN